MQPHRTREKCSGRVRETAEESSAMWVLFRSPQQLVPNNKRAPSRLRHGYWPHWDLLPSCVGPSPVSPSTTSAHSLTRLCRGRLPGLAAEPTSSLLASADCPHGEACRRVGRPVGSSVNGRARVGALEVQREPACSTSSKPWRPPRMPLTLPTATMAAAAAARGMSAATALAATHSSPASCATDQRPAWLHSSWYDVGASAAAARDGGGGCGKGGGGLHPHRGMRSAAGGLLKSVPPPPCPPAPHSPASSAIDGTIATNQTMPTDACCPAWLAGGPSSVAFEVALMS